MRKYNSYYVEKGKDACVSYGSCDFKFKNTNEFVNTKMLLENYSEITVVDPRYFDGDPKLLLLSMQGADVLVLYSRATFLTDQSLERLVPERER